MRAWWICENWVVKKYIDEVFMCDIGKIVANDGRHRTNPTTDMAQATS